MNVSDLPERIAAKISVDRDTGCWVWHAARNAKGYGMAWWPGVSSSGMVAAYRLVYHLANPDSPVRAGDGGLHLDHLCFNKACVNPDHLEPVTAEENHRRYRDTYEPPILEIVREHGPVTSGDVVRILERTSRDCGSVASRLTRQLAAGRVKVVGYRRNSRGLPARLFAIDDEWTPTRLGRAS